MPSSSCGMRNILAAAIPSLVLVFGLAWSEPSAKTADQPAIKKVNSNKVCMLMDRVFDKDQIAATIDGHTYYAFCEMCMSELKSSDTVRTAVDPVTGKKIDKSTAVIGALPDGSVFYFESDKTLEQYQKNGGKKAAEK